MSIASEITRLAGLRDTIRSKLLDFGIITNSAAKLSACSEAIDGISVVTPSTPATSISVTPTISAPTTAGVVTVSGSATASVKPTTAKGYTKGAGTAGTVTANASGTKTITTQAAKTWTPTTKNQTLAAGRWLTGAQTIKGDSNLVAANILKGKSIFGVSGNAITSFSTYTATITLPDTSGYDVDIVVPLNGITPYYVAITTIIGGSSMFFVSKEPATDNKMPIYCASFVYASGPGYYYNYSNLVTATIKNGTMTIPFPRLVYETGETKSVYIVGVK